MLLLPELKFRHWWWCFFVVARLALIPFVAIAHIHFINLAFLSHIPFLSICHSSECTYCFFFLSSFFVSFIFHSFLSYVLFYVCKWWWWSKKHRVALTLAVMPSLLLYFIFMHRRKKIRRLFCLSYLKKRVKGKQRKKNVLLECAIAMATVCRCHCPNNMHNVHPFDKNDTSLECIYKMIGISQTFYMKVNLNVLVLRRRRRQQWRLQQIFYIYIEYGCRVLCEAKWKRYSSINKRHTHTLANTSPSWSVDVEKHRIFPV